MSVALVVLTATLYAQLLTAPWMYEDQHWVQHVNAAAEHWRVPSRTLTIQTLHWTWQMAGVEPALYHAGNTALHVANGVLVYAVTAALIPGSAAAVWGAGVFLLHPLNSEAASYVSARTDLLSTFFILLAVWLSLGHPALWRWPLVGASLVAAGLSKETGLVGVPLLAITLLLWRSHMPLRLIFAPLWIAFGAVLGAAWPSIQSWLTMAPENGGGTFFTWAEFVTLQLTAIWRLLALLVWPDGFSVDHDIIGLSTIWTVTALLLTTVAIAVIVRTWRRAPLVAWSLACAGIALAPRLIFHTNEFVNERQMYLAVAALSPLLGAGLSGLWQWRPAPSPSWQFLLDVVRQWRQADLSRRVSA